MVGVPHALPKSHSLTQNDEWITGFTDNRMHVYSLLRQATTTLSPLALLSLLKSIESRLGRDHHGLRNGPRPLDLDIIFYGNHSVQTQLLHIPHPRLAERPFVLAPLADLLSQERTGGIAGVDAETREGHWSQHPACQGPELRSGT